MTICIVDTSVFCNLLGVPGFNQNKKEALASLDAHLMAGHTLLLPLAAVYESGNHVAHVADGHKRRESACRFVDEVTKAVRGEAPWTPTPFPDQALLADWLGEFPDCAMREVGLADLSIIKEFDRQCALHRMRRVFVWSYDTHLQGYDRMIASRSGGR